jgi:hypothetical protein
LFSLWLFNSLLQLKPLQEGEAKRTEMDSLDWSRKYDVLSISRLYLRSLGLTHEQIHRLADEDMQRITDILQAQRFGAEFDEEVKFTARIVLAEKEEQHGSKEPVCQDRET